MTTHILLRNGSTNQGTFGELLIGDKVFYTVERPWENNKPHISCIPLGDYTLVPHSSDKHPHTFALVNEAEGVYHYPDPNAERYAILIHVANIATDVEGCIGLGTHYGAAFGKWAVLSSRIATEEALDLLQAGDVIRIIENTWNWGD